MQPLYTRQPYTREEILRALDLHERQGLTWPEIEALTGRGHNSLKSTVCRFRAGKWGAPIRERGKQLDVQVEALISAGVTSIDEIARRLGCTYGATYMRLRKMGLDAETIREAAEMARMAA